MGIDHNHPDYIDLRSRIREDPMDFVAVVGAGISKPAGLPTWKKLREHLVQDALSRISGIPEGERDGYKNQLKRIGEESDLWTSFTELKHILSRQAYEGCIKKYLSLEDRQNVPQVYDLLWKLNIKGILTFNIDKCSIDSYAKINQCSVDSATGNDVSRYTQFLSGPQQFVFQPHGIIQDSSTWVFTTEERTKLLKSESYKSFMDSLCQTKHLLIIGFNPDDFAFSYLLQNALTQRSSIGSKHFILLPDSGPGLIRKYGDMGFAVVPYTPSDPETHPEIEETLMDFLLFSPTDDIPGSVYDKKTTTKELPTDEELIQLPVDEARKLLNEAIAKLIPPHTTPQEEDIEKVQKFYKQHIRAIHMAWLVEPDTPYDTIHGYRAILSKGRGAFGQVYEIQHIETEERAAIKVLLPEVRHNPDYLNSFRRGVRSMRILSQRNVKKMVKIIDAFEVPACIIMELIDGPTLAQAKDWGILDTLPNCLDILIQIGSVVHKAHNLEEIVLHRDLKPDNVALRNVYRPDDPIDVVVLDFDLSWHKGASDWSVVHGARAQGYAAPEQTATGMKKGISTRHTAVDVFGYGMLGFFMLVGENPRPNEQNFEGFRERTKETIKNRFNPKWRCLPNYLSGVIQNCTYDTQAYRMSLASAIESFRAAYDMTLTNEISNTNPLILQEMAVILEREGQIKTNDFGRKVIIDCLDPSKQISLGLDNDGDKIIIKIKISKVRSEGEQRNVAKYLESAKNKALANLKSNPFQKAKGIIGQSRLDIFAEWILYPKIRKSDIENVCKRISEARLNMELN